VGLVIEVASSSLNHDRTMKAGVFARDSLPIYWIVNVEDRIVEVYTDPSGDVPDPKYATRIDYAPGSDVPFVLNGQVIAKIPASDFFV
jgi:Uma2 family endonuclease